MNELTPAALVARQGGVRPALVSCLSFEDRSLAVAEAFAATGLDRWLCIVNDDMETDISEIRRRAVAIAASAGVDIEFLAASKRDPIVLADTMLSIARNTQASPARKWIADVTTMTHEMLLVTVAAAEEIIPAWADLSFVYNVAAQYSMDDEVERKWISRGIHELRSVIGYPGAWSPGEPTAMVALPGFDPERMSQMVEDIEPDRLIVGIACPTSERHAWSADRSRRIAQQLLRTREGAMFEYPALDPFAVVDAVVKATQSLLGNVLLAPLNSKISTVAIGVLARSRPEWQVCYAPALIYNLGYATSSDCFLECSLKNMQEHVRTQFAADV